MCHPDVKSEPASIPLSAEVAPAWMSEVSFPLGRLLRRT